MKIDPQKISQKKYPLLRAAVLDYCKLHSIDGNTYAECHTGNDVDHQYPWRSKGLFIIVYTGASEKCFYARDYDLKRKRRYA